MLSNFFGNFLTTVRKSQSNLKNTDSNSWNNAKSHEEISKIMNYSKHQKIDGTKVHEAASRLNGLIKTGKVPVADLYGLVANGLRKLSNIGSGLKI